jgi:NADP-dependent 3-hydroxy acid dehydrogenase YdfG
MDLGLKNRVALVAASSQGIGLATAEAFAAEGCRVAMCARNNPTLQAAAEKIRKQYKTEVLAEAFDVNDAARVSQFVVAVAAKFGSLDICVTNAGGPPAKGFLDTSLEDWQRALDANFLSTVYFAKEVIPHMQRQRWGRIITITSITAKQPIADLVLSNAVRAAVVGLVKSLANEFGKNWPSRGPHLPENPSRKSSTHGPPTRRSNDWAIHGKSPRRLCGSHRSEPPTLPARLCWSTAACIKDCECLLRPTRHGLVN